VVQANHQLVILVLNIQFSTFHETMFNVKGVLRVKCWHEVEKPDLQKACAREKVSST